jgi:dipeptidyl aminopeptidase/acylaminoacyl peptidase
LGGLNAAQLPAAELIRWKSFDDRVISGFLYRAAKTFPGKRPVIINIHGGPEGQSRPGFQGRNNYFMNELGVAMIFPNVRGSVGYGKTWVALDNGFQREDSVKDIGALLDWISEQPDLDAERVMVTGGSYGGYMTLACATHYNDRLRCALDVVGISHFGTFLKNTEAYRRDLRRVEYGDERDPRMASFFEEIAPLNNAGKITKPLFVVQGGNDPRVPLTEAEQIVKRVKQNNSPVWYLMARDEGHGFRRKSNADFQFYATILFIKQYLLGP